MLEININFLTTCQIIKKVTFSGKPTESMAICYDGFSL